jgi:hypothetical protein
MSIASTPLLKKILHYRRVYKPRIIYEQMKKEAKKPNLVLGVIIPIVIFYVFLTFSFILIIFLRKTLPALVSLGFLLILLDLLFIIWMISSYLIKYTSYENKVIKKGKINILGLTGFILVLMGIFFEFIPFIGVLGYLGIIAGFLICLIALMYHKENQKARGFINIGIILSSVYIIFLLISVIITIAMFLYAFGNSS